MIKLNLASLLVQNAYIEAYSASRCIRFVLQYTSSLRIVYGEITDEHQL